MSIDSTRRDLLDLEWARLHSWLKERGVDASLPVDPTLVEVYLLSLSEVGCGTARLSRVLEAIRHHHASTGLPSPTAASNVREVHRALVRGRAGAHAARARGCHARALRDGQDAGLDGGP